MRISESQMVSDLVFPVSQTRENLLQRKFNFRNHKPSDGACEQCKKNRKRLQRKGDGQNKTSDAPHIVHEVLSSSGQSLDPVTRNFFESRFNHDFSRVQVHTDAKAAESSQAVNALAYTVGDNLVFGAGKYAPRTDAGRSLLAHELTHVVQQSKTSNPSANEQRLETEADRVAAEVTNAHDQAPALSPAKGGILQKNGGNQTPRTPQPVAPSRQQAVIIERARLAAAIRTQIALFRLRGIVPPAPSGRLDPAQMMRQRARSLARVMFEWNNPNMDQIERIVSSMVSHLSNPQVMIAGRGDPECGNRAAYVRGFRTPIILCPTFFNDTPEQRIRTMIHEAAHLARIGSASAGESYCLIFDCETSCGGFNSADSWAQFIHCLSGQAADQPTVIRGGRGAQRGGR